MKQIDFFAEARRLKKLTTLDNTLERLDASIDWSIFRHTLQVVFTKEAKGVGGRPPYDYVLMFKILVLQRLYNLSDDATEFQINDRMSFQRFLGLSLSDTVPDAKTIWLFRDHLVKADVIETLFELFHHHLESKGLITHTGSIVDASFVKVPIRRDGKGEKETIESGKYPEDWRENKARQKDVQARWTKKNNQSHFGYKNHIKIDATSKLIVDYGVTPANVHDSQMYNTLLDETDEVVFGDSAYIGQTPPVGVEEQICERGTRGHPLTDSQKEENRKKSKTRSRVEHVFGHIKMVMNGSACRAIGKSRVTFFVGLTNLLYNITRHEYLSRTCRSTG